MGRRPTTRRELMRQGLLAAAGASLASRDTLAEAADPPPLSFRLVESAGLRRFGYPVHTVVPGLVDGKSLRLERDGKPVPAQFRTVTDRSGRPVVALDFVASPGPMQTQQYTVRPGDP